MQSNSPQPVHGTSPVVNAAAWLFILIVTLPVGCGVLAVGGFVLILFLAQLSEWQLTGIFLLFGLVWLTVLGLALVRIVRGALAKRSSRA